MKSLRASDADVRIAFSFCPCYNVFMHTFDHIKDLAHHAYVFVRAHTRDLIDHLEKHHKVKTQGNPDFFSKKYTVFGIDDSRELKELHSSRGFGEESRRFFVLEIDSITHEAQNALLKIFEEPHENVHFFIIIPSSYILLPTLRSRVYLINQDDEELPPSLRTEVESFLSLSKKDRIAFVDAMAEKISEDELGKRDALNFLNALETVIYEKQGISQPEVYESIMKAREYLSLRSSSVKQLLEYVALMVS